MCVFGAWTPLANPVLSDVLAKRDIVVCFVGRQADGVQQCSCGEDTHVVGPNLYRWVKGLQLLAFYDFEPRQPNCDLDR